MTDPRRAGDPRKTAFLVAGVLLLVTAWMLYRGRVPLALALGAASGLLALTGLLWPTGARRFHDAWMRFAAMLGWVNSRILLSLMYFGVFTPYSLVMRLAGRDVLNRRGPGRASYWIPRKHPRQPRAQFERLF